MKLGQGEASEMWDFMFYIYCFLESSFELYQQALRLHSRWLALHKNGTAVPLDTMTDRVVDYYTRAQSAMQDRVSSSLAKYDTFAMMCGIILLFQVRPRRAVCCNSFHLLPYVNHVPLLKQTR